MTVFKVRKAKESYLWAVLILAFISILRYTSITKGLYLSTIFVILLLVSIWYFVFYYSKYTIAANDLICRTATGEKAIDIKSITKIDKGNSIWRSGLFYFWYPYQKGLNIHYGNQEEVFVNPDDQENFIKELLEINPNIKI